MADLMAGTDETVDTAAKETPTISKHVQVGKPKTFNPDALLEAGIGRSAATGAIIGFLAFTVFVALLGKWIGIGDGGSIFLGMFTGMWGGLGFGVMVGSVLAYNRDEKAREAAAAASHSNPAPLHTS